MQHRAVREAIALPEAVGLDLLTDGEQRRLNFQDVFSNSVPDYAQGRTDIAFHEQRVAGAQPLRRFDFAPDEQPGPAVVQRRPVVERLRLVRNAPLEEYRFASAGATRPVKVTLIGPEPIGSAGTGRARRRCTSTCGRCSPTWWPSSGRSSAG